METIEKSLKQFKNENENIQKMIPYFVLALACLVTYFNCMDWHVLTSQMLLGFCGVIFILACFNVEIGIAMATLLMSLHFMTINFGLALVIFLIGLAMTMGLTYGKNNILYLAIFLLILNAKSPIFIGLVFMVYCLHFVNRGFGVPLFTSVLFTSSMIAYGNFMPALFPYEKRVEPLENVIEYLNTTLSDPQLIEWMTPESGVVNVFLETLKANKIFVLLAVVTLYLLFTFLRLTKQGEKELNLSKLWLSFIQSLIVLVGLAFVLSHLSGQNNFLAILFLVIGCILGLGIVLVLPRYPLVDILSYEEKQKLEEQEKLSHVIQEIDKKSIKGGWDTIAGYYDVKEELKQVLEPYLDSKVMKQMKENDIDPVKGILLFGPPGSGKTLFAKAIAAESKMNIISVAGSEFTSKWVGESDKNLREIFNRAKEKAPCIIFFDELESFLPRREDAQHNWEKTLVTTFLAQMDGFNELKDVLVIGATNYPDIIDPAAIRPGRFDKCIYISAPDVEAKIAILKNYLGEKSIFSEEEYRKVALKLERFTAADIEGFVKELYRQNKYQALSFEEMIYASSSFKPTVTLDMLEKYEALEKKYNRRLVNEDKVEIKKYTWDDIAGMEEAKAAIKKYVEKPLLYAEKYKELDLQCPKGTLLFGPPGCGKTLFAKVVSSECHASFFTINGPELLSGKVGESEQKLRRVFRDAREQKPSIIFFDEFDAIAENRSMSQSSVKLINQLLTEMDGMEELDGVIVLAATNRIDMIDPALRRPGRFDQIVYIGLPDIESREKQFEFYLKDQLSDLNYNRFAQLSEGFSCADIAGACRKIKEVILDALIEEKEITLSQKDCEKVIKNTNKTLSDIEIAEYMQLKSFERV